MEKFDANYDLVIVGCGAAGLATALSAIETAAEEREGDLAVVVLERARKDERGGNTRWTSAYLRLKDTETVADRFVEDMLEFSGGRSDERYIHALAERIPETIGWMQAKGVRFDYLPTYFLTLAQPRLQPVGGGAAIVETLAPRVEELSIPILYETSAQRLVLDESGTVTGLEVSGPDGHSRRLGARGVVIASGGFEGSPEMMSRYVGPHADNVPVIAEGGLYNKGEGIHMALDIGAKMAGQWDAFHAEPIDPRSDKAEAVVMVFPYGILVNKDGERFLDEGAGTVDETYEAVSRAILYDQDQTAYLIFDQKMFDIPGYDRAVLTDREPYQAETIADLAEQIDVEPRALERTISAYNAATPEDLSGFDTLKTDGLTTSGDLMPPKSNWARPIDRAPYLAYPLVCSVVFTFGGVATNERAEVIDEEDAAITGLYAAGEATGLYYGKYPGATSVLRCLVFGRIAGQEAACHALRKKAAPGPLNGKAGSTRESL